MTAAERDQLDAWTQRLRAAEPDPALLAACARIGRLLAGGR
jgi:hypothetical protein